MNFLSHIIFYVDDVAKTMAFYEKAFGLERAFIDPSGHYGQLETGTAALSFAWRRNPPPLPAMLPVTFRAGSL